MPKLEPARPRIVDKSVYHRGMLLHGGPCAGTVHGAAPSPPQSNLALPEHLPTIENLREVGKCMDQLTTIAKSVAADLRFKKRWAQIERDLDWS